MRVWLGRGRLGNEQQARPLCTSSWQDDHEQQCEGGPERSWRERQGEGKSRRRKLRPEDKIRGLERREVPGDQVVQPVPLVTTLCTSILYSVLFRPTDN